MDIQVVDPSSYTPPYDHALCSALASAGARVELVCSRFAYGTVPPPRGYTRNELFYRHAVGGAAGRLRSASKLAEHVPDMLRYRRHARCADVVHFQWLPVQAIDGWLLPSREDRRGRVRANGRAPREPRAPLILTSHDILPREPRPGQLRAQRRLYDHFDAIVVHSRRGRERLVRELGVAAERVHVIPHGVFEYLAERAPGAPPAEPPHETDKPVVLMLGLLRPYKGLDVLLDAWRGADGGGPIEGAELWIAGMPRMDLEPLLRSAPGNVRVDARYIDQHELPGYFERADLVVLPYRQADQSGVLFTALAFGKPLLLSDVGGFPELAADTGAARVVASGDAAALARALRELLRDTAALTEMCVRARAAATGDYSWSAVAASHLALYERLLHERA